MTNPDRAVPLPEEYTYDLGFPSRQDISRLHIMNDWGEISPDMWELITRKAIAAVTVQTVVDSEVVGVCFLSRFEQVAELHDLIVDSDHRRRGIGGSLVRECVRQADSLDIRTIDTTLVKSNPLKPLFYELGFKNSRPGSNGAIVLRRELDPPAT